MNLIPRIETAKAKKLAGKKLTMSLADFKPAELWKSFMLRRGELSGTIGNELVSMTIYPENYFVNFDQGNAFEKWAAVEVAGFETIPPDIETFTLPPGLYAVFSYKGLNTDPSIFQYIFGEWLSTCGYALDNRPHFEILGEKYKNNDPNSEEEIWIPIQTKAVSG